jgi:hypothetical protein
MSRRLVFATIATATFARRLRATTSPYRSRLRSAFPAGATPLRIGASTIRPRLRATTSPCRSRLSRSRRAPVLSGSVPRPFAPDSAPRRLLVGHDSAPRSQRAPTPLRIDPPPNSAPRRLLSETTPRSQRAPTPPESARRPTPTPRPDLPGPAGHAAVHRRRSRGRDTPPGPEHSTRQEHRARRADDRRRTRPAQLHLPDPAARFTAAARRPAAQSTRPYDWRAAPFTASARRPAEPVHVRGATDAARATGPTPARWMAGRRASGAGRSPLPRMSGPA